MRTLLINIILVISFQTYAKWNESAGLIVDCELLTSEKLTQISDKLSRNHFDHFDDVIDDWIKKCGVSEFAQRLIILRNIIEKRPAETSILTYLENDLHHNFINRIHDSKRINFGYVYSSRRAYYGYVPLRHPVDSLLINEAIRLLESDSLNLDERLICIFFSGKIDVFEKEIEKSKYKQSYIRNFLAKDYRKYRNLYPFFTLYTGVFRPLRSNDVFSYSPMLGLTITSPVINRYIFEFGFKFRKNINDSAFNYLALGEVNQVNSDFSLFFGGIAGYKLLESEKLTLIPKIGLGFETIDTGISEKKRNSEDIVTYNVETAHFLLGISAMTPIFRGSYLGIGVNYHYCPYHLDKNLMTKIGNNLMSIELFLRL